jgi:hypothetical protein
VDGAAACGDEPRTHDGWIIVGLADRPPEIPYPGQVREHSPACRVDRAVAGVVEVVPVDDPQAPRRLPAGLRRSYLHGERAGAALDRAILPAVPAGKSVASQPLVDVLGVVVGAVKSIAISGVSITEPDGEYSIVA